MGQLDLDFIFNRMPQACMVIDREFRYVQMNDAFCKAVERSKESLLGEYVFEAFPDTPDRIRLAKKLFERTLVDGEVVHVKHLPYQITHPNGEKEDRLWDTEHHPIRGADGEIQYLVQYCEDVTVREALRKERDLVTDELNHRLGNTLAVMQSVANHTADTSLSMEEFLRKFSARLTSISRNFRSLSESNWTGLGIDQIVRTELAPYIDTSSDRVQVSGPTIKLSVQATKHLSMIMHELATNASKYGFLKTSSGGLTVSWGIADERVQIEWKEVGVEGLKDPGKAGFGFQLIDMMTDVKVTREFLEDGLWVLLRMPVSVMATD